jgi:hypothetical protein
MSTKTPRFTLAEKEKVVEEAIKLIKEPASWTTGKWKCDVYLTDENGYLIRDENGNAQPARDFLNRPLAQYCIEGAVNQATYNVVGEERAKKLGAYSDVAGFEGNNDVSVWPTDLLGIDELARRKFPEIIGEEDGEDHAAMTVNDHYEYEPEEGHRNILGLLSDSLAQIKAKRK